MHTQQKRKYKQIIHDANIINISFYGHSLYAVNSILLKVVLLLASMGDLRSSLYLARSQESGRTLVTNGQTLERME